MPHAKTNHRSIAALKLPTAIMALIAYADAIVKAMTGNAAFTSPLPTLAVVSAAIANLLEAQTIALRTRGGTVDRDEKKVALVALLHQLKAYVQSIADANLENGASIITGASMVVRKVTVRGDWSQVVVLVVR